MIRPRHSSLAPWLALALLGGCSERGNGDPAITAVEPARVTTLVATPATIVGENFFGLATASIGNDDPPDVDESWRVRVGDTPIAVAATALVDPTAIDIVIPAGLASGSYDVTVTSPDGRSATLVGGLTVVAEPLGLDVSIETAPAGAGTQIVDETLSAGETLDLYAVLRHEGVFVADVAVTWSVSAPIGVVSAGPSSSTSFAGRNVGTATIAASHATATDDSTGDIEVIAGPAAIINPEDAAGGAGTAVGAVTLSTDDTLPLFAVSRDAFGNYVGDVAVSWTTTGSIGNIAPGPTAAATFDPTTPNSGTVELAHGTIATAPTGTITVVVGQARELMVTPDTLTINADDDPAPFTVAGTDADGNPTTDLGTITWSIESGPITAIHPTTGLLTPTLAGTGRLRADSSYAIFDISGDVTIEPGQALAIEVVPDTLTISADDDPYLFTVIASDGDGNATSDVGTLSWSVDSGPITAIASGSGLFTPTAAGTGILRAASSYGPDDLSGDVVVEPGQAISIAISPDTLTINADDPPVTFLVAGTDGDGNPTTDVGTIGWSIESGPISAINSGSGEFTPTLAGTGTIRAASSYPIFDVSGDITVVPGQATTIVVAPDSAAAVVNGPTVEFSVAGIDGDTNPTSDVGVITWSVPGDLIATLDPASGILTPTAAGVGPVRATSAYGASDDSGDITVHAGLVVTGVTAPLEVVRAQEYVRVDVDVTNYTAAHAPLPGVWIEFAQGMTPVDSDYKVLTDPGNPIEVGAGATTTHTFWVLVSSSPTFGTVEITGTAQGYLSQFDLFTADAGVTSWDVINTTGPNAIISKPALPDNLVCVGDGVDFGGSDSTGSGPLTFQWDFPGASPLSATTVEVLGVTYDAMGMYPYALTVTDSFGRDDTALRGAPIYVGALGADQVPTGEIRFDKPATGELIEMDKLPDNVIDMQNGGGDELTTCDGNQLDDAGPNCYVTLFVDRGRLDLSRDLPGVPGVQVELHECDHFDDVELSNTVPRLEGPAMLYAEFRKEPEGIVTAAGHTTFSMTNDEEAPAVTATQPEANCAATCYGKGWRWLFRLSEPMNAASVLAATLVEYSHASNCGGSWTDITAGSSLSYDELARTLRVTPEVQGLSNYSVRVSVGVGATDTSSNSNPLAVPFTRCAVVTDQPAPPSPAAPIVLVAPLSPDGDGVEDTTTFATSVDAAADTIRISIWRGQTDVITLLLPVAGAGTYGVVWDGRDNSGRVVEDGYYGYQVVAESSDGGSSAKVMGVVLVDNAVSFIGVWPRF